MNYFITNLIIIILLHFSSIQDVNSLKDVSLEFIPKKVQRGQDVQLRCYYDLEGIPLYAAKYYYEDEEFYSYMPQKTPSKTTFLHQAGIIVDVSNSSASHVTIMNPMSGEYRCEITGDGPMYDTATGSQTLTVVNANTLKDVRLELIPEKVERGQDVQIRCHYNLEEAVLYSVKYYHENYEFYRYVPSETPATKTFHLSGINVDPLKSNASQVTIKNVDFSVSGKFTCEVSEDAPSFSAATSSQTLKVVSTHVSASNQCHRTANMMIAILSVMQLYLR